MGEIAPIGDAAGLAAALLRVLESPERYRRPAADIRAMFRREATLDAYEAAYRRIAPAAA
jgi:glycosyltransferase involved in cell wall biosynthesis